MPREELPKNPPKAQKERKEWYEKKERIRRRQAEAAEAKRQAELGLGAKPAATQSAKPVIADHAELGTLLRNAGYKKHLDALESLRQAHGNDVINHFLGKNPFERNKSTAAVDALGEAARAGELKRIAESLPKKAEAAQAKPRFSFTEWNSHESISRTVSNAISAWHYTEKKTLPPGTLEKVTPQLINEILASDGEHPVVRGCQEAIRVLVEQKEASKYDDSVRQLGEAITGGTLREALDHGKVAPKPTAPESSVTDRASHERMAGELKNALRTGWSDWSPKVLGKVTPELMREILDLENHHPDVNYFRKLLGIVIDRSDADKHDFALEELGRAIREGTLREALDHGKEAPKRLVDASTLVAKTMTAELIREILTSDSVHPDLGEYRRLIEVVAEQRGGCEAAVLRLSKAIESGELRKVLDHRKRKRRSTGGYEDGGGIRVF